MEDKILRSGDSDQIVGLMGMSFLSRFDVVVKADGVEFQKILTRMERSGMQIA